MVRRLLLGSPVFYLVLVPLLVPVIVLVMWNRGRTMRGHAKVAADLRSDPRLERIASLVPQDGRDISYYCRPYGGVTMVSFALTEDRFVEWARHEEWQLRLLDFDWNILEPAGNYVTVGRGYYWLTENSFPDIQVFFDSDTGRVYYREILWED